MKGLTLLENLGIQNGATLHVLDSRLQKKSKNEQVAQGGAHDFEFETDKNEDLQE